MKGKVLTLPRAYFEAVSKSYKYPVNTAVRGNQGSNLYELKINNKSMIVTSGN